MTNGRMMDPRFQVTRSEKRANATLLPPRAYNSRRAGGKDKGREEEGREIFYPDGSNQALTNISIMQTRIRGPRASRP